MRVLEARGTPFEIGEMIGSAAPDLVRRSIEQICRFETGRDEIERRLGPIKSRLLELFPEVLEEADGLAQGAGVSRTDALALSVASDLHGKLPGWCSLLAVPGEDGLLVGKNLDTSREMGSLQVMERIERRGAFAFTHLTTAGAMWTDGGVNDAGLALVNSSLAAARMDPTGVPDGILAREILARCATVPAAVALAERIGVMTLGETLLVGDADGRSAVVETLPDGRATRTGGNLVACNHPLEERLAHLAAPHDPIRENSERRLGCLEAEVGRAAPWTLEGLATVLGGEEICQHGDAGLWTVASIAASPSQRRMWVADGPPCLTAFEEVVSGRKKEAAHVPQ